MTSVKRNLAAISPWILAAACALLLFILGVFALSNYTREKKLMTEALVQKGQTVINSIMSGVRVALRTSIQFRGGEEFRLVDQIQNVIEQVYDLGDMHFVYLVDQNGTIVASSDPKRIGTLLEEDLLAFAGKSIAGDIHRMQKGGASMEPGFQIAHQFLSEPQGRNFPSPQGGPQWSMPHHMMMPMMDGRGWGKRLREELDKLGPKNLFLLIELDIDQYDRAVRRQLVEIFVLACVLLLVGVGGWLSLLTVQHWRGSQQRLGRLSAFNDILIHSLPAGIITFDSGKQIQSLNMAAENMIGVRGEEATGLPASACLPAELCRELDKLRPDLSPTSREITIPDTTKTMRELVVSVHEVHDQEKHPVGTVLLLQDLSEIKKLERELQRHERLAALGKMAAGVAHELRNPLSSVKGLAVLLRSKLADNEDKNAADVLVGEVERLNRSIGELLEYARPEKLIRKKCSMRDILHEASALIVPDAQSMQITVAVVPDEGNDEVFIDPDKMKQVLLNLFLNAFQAMDTGGMLTITSRVLPDCRNMHVDIEDSGKGISPEILPHIFDPYFTTKHDGSGLGLAMSAKIVEEHGGRIEVQSAVGHGTRMRLILPCYLEADRPV